MIGIISGFSLSFLFYLILTAGSGELILWSRWEIIFGFVFALITALGLRKLFKMVKVEPGLGWLNPIGGEEN